MRGSPQDACFRLCDWWYFVFTTVRKDAAKGTSSELPPELMAVRVRVDTTSSLPSFLLFLPSPLMLRRKGKAYNRHAVT